MSRARSFCRQEAGAAGDDLPVRFRAARAGRTCPSRGRRKRGGGCNDGRDDREERDSGERETSRLYAGGHVRRAKAASHFERDGGVNPESNPREYICTCRERTGETARIRATSRGMESMRSLYSARQKRLVRYTP